jgi:phosphatidylglycerophosphate synthase
MAYVRSTYKRPAPSLPIRGRPGLTPLAAFAAAFVALAIGLEGMVLLLPGTGPLAAGAAFGVFALTSAVAARSLVISYPHDGLGLCNVITLTRLALAAALVAPLVAGAGPAWSTFAVAVTALALDGFDGWLARRQGFVSEFGARFDMEVDSVLALVLALGAALGSAAGPAALLLGLPRYVFGAAAWVLPWMRRDLPERFSRKAVCVLQLGALIALQAPILPAWLAIALVPLAAAALAWSFVLDVRWLWRHRHG